MWFYIVSSTSWNKDYSLYVLFKDGDYYKVVGMKNRKYNRKIMTSYKTIEENSAKSVFHFSQIPPDLLITSDNMKEFMYINKILFKNENIYYYREVNFSSELENKLIHILTNYIKDYIDDYYSYYK